MSTKKLLRLIFAGVLVGPILGTLFVQLGLFSVPVDWRFIIAGMIGGAFIFPTCWVFFGPRRI